MLSLGTVIVGHWLMAVLVFFPDGRAATSNALAFIPWAEPATWLLQVMSLFFFVGGAAHWHALRALEGRGGNYADFLGARVIRLLLPTAAFILAWTLISLIAGFTGLHTGVFGVALRIAAQPLWFLAVYLAVIVLALPMRRLHDRFGVLVPTVMVGLVVLADIGRLGFDLAYLGVVNYLLCWLLCHQMGYLYADGSLSMARPLAGRVLFAGGLVTLIGLTTIGPYPVSMVGLPGAPFSNMSPPSLALLVQAMMLLGLVLLCSDPARRWLERPRVWLGVVAANTVAMTAFLWHLTAAFLVVGALVVLGVRMPEPGSPAWWLSRPGWLAALGAVTFAIVLLFRRFELPNRHRPLVFDSGPWPSVLAVAGTVLVAAGVLGYAVNGFTFESAQVLRSLAVDLDAFGPGLLMVGGWLLVLAGASRSREHRRFFR